jgi:hypothetical protein
MDKKLIDNLSENTGQDKQQERYEELTTAPLRQVDYIDPAKAIEFVERRTRGCFGCLHSKRGVIKNRVKSYCQPMEDGITTKNYPDETKDTCEYFCDKRKRRLDT